MRKLNTADVFALCRVIKATGAREQLQAVVVRASKEKEQGKDVDLTKVGVDGFMTILEAAVEPSVEAMIYKLLSGPLECEPAEVANMELAILLENLKKMAEDNDLSDFFDSVSGMI